MRFLELTAYVSTAYAYATADSRLLAVLPTSAVLVFVGKWFEFGGSVLRGVSRERALHRVPPTVSRECGRAHAEEDCGGDELHCCEESVSRTERVTELRVRPARGGVRWVPSVREWVRGRGREEAGLL